MGLRENRVKFQQLTNTGSLTADVNQYLSIYNPFEQQINGEVLKVYFKAGNQSNSGSIGLLISGTDERIWTWKDSDTSTTDYLGVYVKDNIGTVTGSPNAFAYPILAGGDTLYLWGSGLGAGKSGLGVTIFYR